MTMRGRGPAPSADREVASHCTLSSCSSGKATTTHATGQRGIFSDKQKKVLTRLLSGVNTASDDNVAEGKSSEAALPDEVPMVFVLCMRISGGTYVRSIVHDLAHALSSVGHVVTLTRSPEEEDHRYVPWEVFGAALAAGRCWRKRCRCDRGDEEREERRCDGREVGNIASHACR